MANLNSQFLRFSDNITVPKGKIEALINSRKALERKIKEYFKQKEDVMIPRFYIQGSYKMGTMILKKDGTYDVDLGVYFLEKPNKNPETLQRWVLGAVKNHTDTPPQHKEKCVRVIYKGDFDIDLPVYYKRPKDKHPHLATKKKWEKSDPKELCDWFNGKIDKEGQMKRLIKYFKAWADERSKKMPSGIAFTVWVANYFRPDERDDMAFYKTAKAIKYAFFCNGVTCKNPATPRDDLTDRLDENQKKNFRSSFKQLITEGKKAIDTKGIDKACNIWQNQLGDKFPRD